MFKFLKDRIKSAISSISKKVEEEPKETKLEEEKKAESKETGFIQKIKEKITTRKLSEGELEDLLCDLETALLENNVAYGVFEKIKLDLGKQLLDKQISRREIKQTIERSLRNSLTEILDVPKIDLLKFVKDIKKENRPAVLLVLGYNGAGKSLSVARLAKYFKDHNIRAILAAGDTFRAAGITQLMEYASKIDVPVVKHKIGGDSCAVIFDAVNAAKARNYEVVIADTAGRVHSNKDLMGEMKKIVRINNPDMKILVLDALTGTDIVEQTRQFEEAIGVDALIFTKVDIYEKGGGILSGIYTLKKPVLFFGVGQQLDSFVEYNQEKVLESLGF